MTDTLDVRQAPILLGRFVNGSPEWHAARANGLGGSEISAVVGLSPWESRLSLWHRKRGELPALDLTDEMDAGNRCEPMTATWFFDHHAWWAQETGATYAHPARPWQVANPDIVLITDQWQMLGHTPDGEPLDRATGVELKFSLYGDGFGPAGSDEIPVYYVCQCLWYCDVMGWPGMWLVVFIGALGQFRQYWIDADQDEIEFLREHGRAFVESLPHLEQRPDIDLHQATYRAVRDLHPDIDADLTIDIEESLALDWHAKKAVLKHAEREERQANAVLLDALGDARRGRVDGRNTVIRVPSQGGGTPHLRSSRTRRKAS